MARFTREAQVVASLNHPNIAAIYGVEERALVIELVEEALAIARQIAEALDDWAAYGRLWPLFWGSSGEAKTCSKARQAGPAKPSPLGSA
jgi:hypothetical protein